MAANDRIAGRVRPAATPQGSVLTFGEALVVFHPASAPVLHRDVAGAEVNMAVALARLGRPVTYVTRVGDDPFGRAIADRLAPEPLQADVRVDAEAPTGIYFREHGDSGPRRVYYYRAGSAASRLGPADLPDLQAFALVHATGITAALSASCRAAVEHAAGGARAFSLDVNHRPALISAADLRDAIEPWLARCDLVFLSDDDAAVLGPDEALAAGARAVVHTQGERGARYIDRDGGDVHVAPPPVDAVDTVGAGDAFAAGFLDAWLDGAAPAAALERGCALGAAAVARLGDLP
jgi:2-dehydro-3-deoxygluconokinase